MTRLRAITVLLLISDFLIIVLFFQTIIALRYIEKVLIPVNGKKSQSKCRNHASDVLLAPISSVVIQIC